MEREGSIADTNADAPVPIEWVTSPPPYQLFESTEPAPTSAVYRAYVADRTRNLVYRRYMKWFLMALAGVLIGCVGCILRQSVTYLIRVRQQVVFHVIESFGVFAGSAAHTGMCFLFASTALIITLILAPAAAGAGLTDIIAILNGVRSPILVVSPTPLVLLGPLVSTTDPPIGNPQVPRVAW